MEAYSEKWFVYAKKADFRAWADQYGIDPVIARIIRNRDVVREEEVGKFLYGGLKDCHSPWLMKDVDLAVEALLRAVEEGLRIRVIGDYDVDGICSSYILTKGIALLGAQVDTAIPHRIHDGYGLNENLITEAAKDGVGLIVTCDNGIAAGPQVKLAKQMGIQVIVTDHHEVPFVMEGEVRREQLPEALAVVDPKREEDTYPFSGICGGVVAYKLMQAVLERLMNAAPDPGRREMTARADRLQKAMEEFLEFAAFSTVCDVMELKDENRILVKEGIRQMKHSHNPGLRALMEVNAIDASALSAYHLGFVLGPCLNATGRLDTARRALELLKCEDPVSAVTIARDLKELNDSRKNLTLQGIEMAKQIIVGQGMENDKVLVVYLPEVHESLAGIIAGKIREQYGHPAFILTNGEEGIKGSGRSIEGYDMHGALTEVGHLLSKFGGHKMAAGLSLPEGNLEAFRREINANCRLSQEEFLPILHIDLEMPLQYASRELAKQLELLEPFGMGNPKPLFVQKDLVFLSGARIGKNGQYGKFQVRTPEGERRQLTFFGDVDRFMDFLDQKYGACSGERLFSVGGEYGVTVVYQLGINSFRGTEELQILMKSYK